MPFFMPYRFPMLAALGRVRSFRRWILWLLAWTLAAVPAFGGWTRYLALSFPVAVWLLISPKPFQRYQDLFQRSRRILIKGKIGVG